MTSDKAVGPHGGGHRLLFGFFNLIIGGKRQGQGSLCMVGFCIVEDLGLGLGGEEPHADISGRTE